MHDDTPKPRWWTRLLSRPGWLVLLAVCLLLGGYLGRFWWWSHRTDQLVAGIEQAGGGVVFRHGGTEWLCDTFGEQWFQPWDKPFRVETKDWSATSGLSAPIVGGQTLDEKFTDDQFSAYVVPLDELNGLESLAIIHSDLTERSYRQLSQFQQLHDLSISDQQFDDDALALFSKAYKLRTLDLSGTSVSDEGLRHLKGLKNLESLSLSNTDVTDDGVSELQRHLPRLDVSDD